MSDLVFNVAKGRAAYYGSLPLANDAIIVVPFEAAGLPSDTLMRDYVSLTAIKAAATEHAMGRKTVTSLTVNVDQGNDRVDVDMPDQTWTAVVGNPIGCLVFCYDPDTTGGTDADLIPLTKHDFVVTPNGTDIVAQMATTGFYRAT